MDTWDSLRCGPWLVGGVFNGVDHGLLDGPLAIWCRGADLLWLHPLPHERDSAPLPNNDGDERCDLAVHRCGDHVQAHLDPVDELARLGWREPLAVDGGCFLGIGSRVACPGRESAVFMPFGIAEEREAVAASGGRFPQ